jgi:hypothetical protein
VTETALIIREGRQTDLPAILQLYAQPEIDDGAVLPLGAAEDIYARFARYPHYKLYVAEQDGRIVGSYAFLVMHNLGHLGAAWGRGGDVGGDPAWPGKGQGPGQIRHAMAEAGAAGC